MYLKKSIAFFIVFLTVFAGVFTLNAVNVYAEDENTVNVVFTHDIHSYLSSYNTLNYETEEIEEIGGIARLSTIIKEQRLIDPDTLVLDGGDISMGTLFQTRFAEDALELRALGILGYDAVTIGNHEFDFGTDGLVSMLSSAAKSGDAIPQFIISNVDWEKNDEATRSIHEALTKCNYHEYSIIEKNGVSIALIGIYGEDAISCAPSCELSFNDQVESARKMVDKIKAEGGADMYVCLSHSGTSNNSSDSEDEILAKAVPELDLIISAHSHTILQEPIICGDTIIASCGCYGENTGVLSMTQKADGRWQLGSYKLIRMDSNIEEDPDILKILDTYKEIIDENYLSDYGLKANDLLAKSNFNFCAVNDLYYKHGEHNLGDLISDAYRYAIDNTKAGIEDPIDFSIAPSGTIRGTFYKGDIFVNNAFEAFSLGKGFDGSVGYPLIDFYLIGSELKTLCELDALAPGLMDSANLYMSGLSFSYNPKRLILNKVTDAWMSPVILDDETREEIEDDKLYHVVSDLYSGRMLGAATEISKGILALHPLDKDGNELRLIDGEYDYEPVCSYDDEGRELKAWVAIAEYLGSFDKDENGVSVIPEYYASEEHSRKVCDEKKGLISFFKNSSKIAKIVYLIVVVLIMIIVLVVWGIVRLIKKIVKRKKIINLTLLC